MFSLTSPVLLQIWQARMQIFPRSLRQFEAPIGNPVEDAKDDNKRIGLQDFFVVRSVTMMPPFVRLPFDRACARDRRKAGAFRTGRCARLASFAVSRHALTPTPPVRSHSH